ncbi:hypothetical protein FPOAC2_07996 [Fusarium poae]|jgi:hypothetical protein|uniref:Uncharacterized protein n=1 Tax=Fusarium poae TaxID=36050 RepID=A0A1B8AKS8_FUSPO|nr:hypothetical protein FPOAC1_008079 [Fusarium poae]KAG8668696.1 hypothetical protein FPOAC1_008079 [Fusarium poae]OBS20931.1 hypothetical protein FPOA_07271 [Fusarium poae]
MNTTFTQVHGMVQLPPMDARITPPPEELNVVIPKLQTCHILPPSPQSLPGTPYPETPSTSNPSPRKRQRRRSSSSRSRPSRPDAKQQPQANSRLLFEPRPFENLFTDQAYLAGVFQQQASRASELMRRYCAVEQQLRNLDGDQGRRKLRKQLSLLKSQMNQAVEQEKIISSRLFDLYVEMQSRETWAQAWTATSPSVGSPYCLSPDPCSFSAPATPLVGSSGEFVPMGYDFHQPAGPFFAPSEPAVWGLETVDEAAEDLLYGPDSSSASIESETTPATPIATELPFAEEKNDSTEIGDELDDSHFVVTRERRMSLPCLRHAWPEA